VRVDADVVGGLEVDALGADPGGALVALWTPYPKTT